MSGHEWDVIVVGSGHNGLVAAGYVAAANKKVLVLERQPYFGGGVASAELTAPGFIHERHGTVHAKIMANPLITEDELGLQTRYGLSYVRPADSYGAIFEDGSWIGLSHDRDRTLASLALVAPEDVESYRAFAAFATDVVHSLIPGFFSPPTALGEILSALEASPHGQRVARMMLQSARDVICEHFASDKLRVALLRLVAELLIVHPDEKGTGLFAVAAVGFVDGYGFALPRGGGNALTSALLRCVEDRGGVAVDSTTVDEVIVRNGRAVGVRTADGQQIFANDAVIAAIHPHHLGATVPGLPPVVIEEASRVELSHFTGFVVQAALDVPLRFRNDLANDCALVTVGATNLDDTLRAFDNLKRGRLSDKPLLWATAMPDTDRAPAGQGVLHCYCMTTYRLGDDGPAGWQERKDAYATEILDRLASFTHPLRVKAGSVMRILTPIEHERNTPSFAAGDLNGAGMFLHQTGSYRPTAALSQFAVPGADGLYLVGPFMHPGGGITGGGRATAKKVLADLRIDFDEVVRAANPDSSGTQRQGVSVHAGS